MDTYFPAGVRLGWLIDPINKMIYTFMRESDGVVRRRPHQWYTNDGSPGVLKGGEVLPGFTLRLEKLDQLLSQVWFCLISLRHLNWPQVKPHSGGPSRRRISCPGCDKTFFSKPKFLEHFQEEH
jgi:hypothetical protein